MTWSHGLPTKQGWYWARTPPGKLTVCFLHGDLDKQQNHDHFYQRQPWEWWPERIEPPKSTAAAAAETRPI